MTGADRIRRGSPAPPSPWAPIGDEPVAGYYKTRRVRHGIWVAVRLWLDADRHEPGVPENKLDRAPIWRAELDGVEVEFDKVWPWAKLIVIDRAEYRFLLADAAHARAHRPDSPEANPTKAVDVGSMPALF